MQGVTLNTYTYIEIILKKKSNPATTKTVRFSDRVVLNDDNFDRYKPLLIRVRGVGNEQSDFLPKDNRASYVLDNSFNSFSFNRRVVDLFDEWTPLHQEISLYHAESEDGDNNLSDKAVLVRKDKCTRVRANFENETITLQVQSSPIKSSVLTYIADVDTGAAIPTSNIGKAIPLVFGSDIEVRPVAITDSTIIPIYAYATSLKDQFANGGVQKVFSRPSDAGSEDREGFIEITDRATTTTAIFTNGSGVRHTGITPGRLVQGEARQMTMLGTGTVLTSFDIEIFTLTSGPTAGETWTFHVWQRDGSNDIPSSTLRTVGQSAQVDISGFTANTNTLVSLPFLKPIVIRGDRNYYFGYTKNDDTNSTARVTFSTTGFNDLYTLNPLAGAGDPQWFKTTSGSPPTEEWFFDIFGLVFSEITPVDFNDFGLGYNAIQILQRVVPGEVLSDIADLPYIFEIDGIEDDSSGNVTGSVNKLIDSAAHAIELMSYEFNGSAWVAGNFDDTVYTDTHVQLDDNTKRFYRQLGGTTAGRTSRESLFADIARNTASRVVSSSPTTNKIGLYAWGETQAIADIITDEDAEFIEFFTGDLRSIVNQSVNSFDKTLTSSNFRDQIGQGGQNQFDGVKNLSFNDSSLGEDISADSETLFDDKDLRNNKYEFISDADSMCHVAESILRTHDLPSEWARVRVMFIEYSSLKPFDIVNLISPQLPSTPGTSPDPLVAIVDTEDAELIWKRGEHFLRGKNYRAQIYDLKLIHSVGGPLLMDLICRLLIHPNDPTGNASIPVG